MDQENRRHLGPVRGSSPRATRCCSNRVAQSVGLNGPVHLDGPGAADSAGIFTDQDYHHIAVRLKHRAYRRRPAGSPPRCSSWRRRRSVMFRARSGAPIAMPRARRRPRSPWPGHRASSTSKSFQPGAEPAFVPAMVEIMSNGSCQRRMSRGTGAPAASKASPSARTHPSTPSTSTCMSLTGKALQYVADVITSLTHRD